MVNSSQQLWQYEIILLYIYMSRFTELETNFKLAYTAAIRTFVKSYFPSVLLGDFYVYTYSKVSKH